jgi:CRISPR/Cas system Type II protein with McrA/HNH and RuvC-like nuclease domain
MGHKGDMDATYTTNKSRLPEHVLEDMREAYQRAQAFVGTDSGPQPVDKMEAVVEAMRRMAEAYGIDPMRVRIERQKELGRNLDSEEEIQAMQNEIKKTREGEKDPQTIVKEGELESYLRDGW